MLRIFKKKTDEKPSDHNETSLLVPNTEAATSAPVKAGFFSRLKQGLQRTRTSFSSGLANLLLGKKALDDELIEQLETLLLSADVGIEVTQLIITELTERIARKNISDEEALLTSLKTILTEILTPCQAAINLAATPTVILMVGINGAGKTTTTGKLAKYWQQADKKVMLAAGDTFRAAAVEQLQVWGERNNIVVVAQQQGADSAAVIFDAMQSAAAKKIDILIADTAGRLHTQTNLMAELQKITRVITKANANAPHEVLLVLDASIGQNAIAQAEQFKQAVGVSGLCLTKLDGTAKGGVIFAIAKKLALPIRFIGVGEAIDDLRPFVAQEFVDALFAKGE